MNKKLVKSYKIGLELETVVPENRVGAIHQAVSDANLPYEADDDGSIEYRSGVEEGVEFKSREPLTYTTFERSIKAFTKILEENDTTVNRSCGFHVHMSNKRFADPRIVKRIVFLWCAIEDVLMATQPKSRYNNDYCRRLLKRYASEGIELPKAKEHLIDHLSGFDRYYMLNLASMSKHGTIECRLHSGTISSQKIIMWVRLLQAVYTYAISSYRPGEVKKLFDMSISDEKVNAVFELLKLEPDVREHFTARISKFAFKALGLQQESAKKSVLLLTKRKRAAEAYNRAERVLSNVRSEQREMMQAFNMSL